VSDGKINNLKARVQILMAERGMDMKELAQRMGVSTQTVYTILGKANPRVDTLTRFAEAFGVDVSVLLEPVTAEEYGNATIPRGA